ncbi:riboflavin synthase subunit beta [Ichthyenterobacterium magnum]|uniref:Riboflavin synthase subunit beta n=1 Tax=Ichthyenterobacterium magnum TaxID=1230530 RepID=A0A420DGU7_9FLAO|nr:riboflavin synthase subunit beta [Ichthyenterobacterium magnum]RKE92311.1 hypothetical protein BXY80_2230 [Ichthyenterobacterium magnum]
MGAFGTRKNKKFEYTPRYYKGEKSPYEIKHKFDDFRSTVGNNKGIKTKFVKAVDDYKHNPDRGGANKRVLIIVGVLIVLFLFLIDFDLSIFFPKR